MTQTIRVDAAMVTPMLREWMEKGLPCDITVGRNRRPGGEGTRRVRITLRGTTRAELAAKAAALTGFLEATLRKGGEE